MKVKSLSRVRLCATPWTAAHQASPSMGFSRQEYWSGLPCLPLEDLLDPRIRASNTCVYGLGFFMILEKAMAPHSSTLAWKIPWMEKPGGLQSMGSRGVRHDWATSLSLFTFMHWRRQWQPTPLFLPGESQGWRSLVGCRLWGHTVGHDWSDLAAAAATQLNTIFFPPEIYFLNILYVY